MENQDENTFNQNQDTNNDKQAPEGKGPIIGVIIIIIILALASFYVFSTRQLPLNGPEPQDPEMAEDDWFMPNPEEEYSLEKDVIYLTEDELDGLTDEEVSILLETNEIEIID